MTCVIKRMGDHSSEATSCLLSKYPPTRISGAFCVPPVLCKRNTNCGVVSGVVMHGLICHCDCQRVVLKLTFLLDQDLQVSNPCTGFDPCGTSVASRFRQSSVYIGEARHRMDTSFSSGETDNLWLALTYQSIVSPKFDLRQSRKAGGIFGVFHKQLQTAFPRLHIETMLRQQAARWHCSSAY